MFDFDARLRWRVLVVLDELLQLFHSGALVDIEFLDDVRLNLLPHVEGALEVLDERRLQITIAKDGQVWVLQNRFQSTAVRLVGAIGRIEILLRRLVLLKEPEDVDLILRQQLRKIVDKDGLENGLVFGAEQVLHQKEQWPIQVVVQALLDERFVIPIGHEEILRFNLQNRVNLLQDFAFFIVLVRRIVQHVVNGRVFADLAVIHLNAIHCMNQILDRRLEAWKVQRAEASSEEEVPELEVALRLLLLLALEYLLETRNARRDIVDLLLVQLRLHGDPVEDLLGDDVSVEAGGAQRDQLPWLSIQRVLLVPNVHERRPVLKERIGGRLRVVGRADHLIDEDGLWRHLLRQRPLALVDQNALGYFVLAATLEIDEALGRRQVPEQEHLLPGILLDDVKAVLLDVLPLRVDRSRIGGDHRALFVDHVQVEHQVGAGDQALVADMRNEPVILPELLLPNEALVGARRRQDVLEAIRFNLRIRQRVFQLLAKYVNEVRIPEYLLGAEVHEVAVDLKHLRVLWVHREADLESGTVLLDFFASCCCHDVLEVAARDAAQLLGEGRPRRTPAKQRAIPRPTVLVHNPVIVQLHRGDRILNVPEQEEVAKLVHREPLRFVLGHERRFDVGLDQGDVEEAEVPLEHWRRPTRLLAGEQERRDLVQRILRIIDHLVHQRTRHHRRRLGIVLVLEHHVVIVTCVDQLLDI